MKEKKWRVLGEMREANKWKKEKERRKSWKEKRTARRKG